MDGARHALVLLAVELRDATDLVGCASKGTAREIATIGGNPAVEVGVRNRGWFRYMAPLSMSARDPRQSGWLECSREAFCNSTGCPVKRFSGRPSDDSEDSDRAGVRKRRVLCRTREVDEQEEIQMGARWIRRELT